MRLLQDKRLILIKLLFFFSSNTRLETQESIKQALGAETVPEYKKYLRLPSIMGRNKKTAFTPIIERVWSKLKGWKEKTMSQVGREILIKSWHKLSPHICHEMLFAIERLA